MATSSPNRFRLRPSRPAHTAPQGSCRWLLRWRLPPLLLAAVLPGQTPALPPVVEHLDLRYSEAASDPQRNRLDLYVPGGAPAAPVVLFVHGGGWVAGDKRFYRRLGRYLASHGLAAALINYRLHPFDPWPACAEDCARACAFLREHGSDFDVDGERLLLAGHSAGAQIAGAVAYDPRWLHASGAADLRPQAFAGLSGVYDLRPEIHIFTRLFGPDLAARASASPIEHAGADSPPTLLLWAEHDLKGLPLSARMLAARLRTAGAEVSTREFAGHSHATYVQRVGGRRDALGPALVQFLRACCAPAGSPAGSPSDWPSGPPSGAAEATVVDETVEFAPQRCLTVHLRRDGDATARRPLVVLVHGTDQQPGVVGAAARRWAARGPAVAVVGCDGDRGTAAIVAAACAALRERSLALGIDGIFLAGLGGAAAPTLLAAVEPRWLEPWGLTRRDLRGVVTIAATGAACADGNTLDWLPAGDLPVLPIVPADEAPAARALTAALVQAGNFAIPVPGLDASNCLRGATAGADPVAPLLLGFVGS